MRSPPCAHSICQKCLWTLWGRTTFRCAAVPRMMGSFAGLTHGGASATPFPTVCDRIFSIIWLPNHDTTVDASCRFDIEFGQCKNCLFMARKMLCQAACDLGNHREFSRVRSSVVPFLTSGGVQASTPGVMELQRNHEIVMCLRCLGDSKIFAHHYAKTFTWPVAQWSGRIASDICTKSRWIFARKCWTCALPLLMSPGVKWAQVTFTAYAHLPRPWKTSTASAQAVIERRGLWQHCFARSPSSQQLSVERFTSASSPPRRSCYALGLFSE